MKIRVLPFLPFLKFQPQRRVLFLLLGSLALLVLGAGYWWWHGYKGKIKYISLPAGRGSIIDAINAAGMVEAVKSTGLDFKSGGVIKEVFVETGDYVKAGQLLASLDPADLEAQVAQARASLESAQAKLQLLKSEPLNTDVIQAETNVAQAQITYQSSEESLKRNQALFDSGSLTQADLNSSISSRDTAAVKLRQVQAALEALKSGSRPEDITAAQAQVDSARAQLQIAQNNLESAQLQAPWDGVISAIQSEVGHRISSGSSDSSSTGYITLVSSELRLRAQVNEADIGKIKIGQGANFTVNAFPEKTFEGQVTWIAPQAATVSNVQLYDTLVSVEDPEHLLKVGMSASINIIINQKDNVITIPRAAVTFAANNRALISGTVGGIRAPGGGAAGTGTPASGDGTGKEKAQQATNASNHTMVLINNQGHPVARQIVAGMSDDRNIEVIEGLQAGEQVIIGSSKSGELTAGGGSSTSSPSRAPQTTMTFMRGR